MPTTLHNLLQVEGKINVDALRLPKQEFLDKYSSLPFPNIHLQNEDWNDFWEAVIKKTKPISSTKVHTLFSSELHSLSTLAKNSTNYVNFISSTKFDNPSPHYSATNLYEFYIHHKSP